MIHPHFDAYTKELSELIDYGSEAIESFHVYGYEWIDNLHFLLTPSQVIADDAKRDAMENIVRARFTNECDWEGTGRLSLLWLPPFLFPHKLGVKPEGVIVWHVKQHEDGLSFLLSPIPLPFEPFSSNINQDGQIVE